ncbi:hypothetical protein L596_022402 [Steinernema carpocapsae]|uniref:26S proteasome non-ATPase regulatory subunit 13 n=1 Tax=Steinernema carpocapsae TaxID=34508 RepID=A0A4V6XVX4_STECR|nr:hypothetical protein L596_022402 [Steinernema carpocapsae]
MASRSDIYLDAAIVSADGNDALQDQWTQLKDFYQEKRWHQLTKGILEGFANNCLGSPSLEQMYDNFICDFKSHVNLEDLAVIVIYVADDIFKTQQKAAIEFLQAQQEIFIRNKAAYTRIQVGVIDLFLKIRDVNEALVHKADIKVMIEAIEKEVEKLNGITMAHAPFYRVYALFHRETKNYAAYYREALRYLGCEDLKILDDTTKVEYAVLLCFAALLGQDVYNFGELLAHPVLEFIAEGQYKWLYDLVMAFNAGDIHEFQALETKWGQWPDLKENEAFIMDKIRILSFMELASVRRNIPLVDIAKKAQVAEDKAEFLVMRAISKKLAEGSIDQVKKVANITWVAPRVLNKAQIGTLADRFVGWINKVETVADDFNANAGDIIVKN